MLVADLIKQLQRLPQNAVVQIPDDEEVWMPVHSLVVVLTKPDLPPDIFLHTVNSAGEGE